ncbi:MFS transporter [Nocardioides albus]|uniref:Putative MFS transporter n=1 Tax=Nocardioides albus TaxID=1841 RepID=A0A7W5F991_9ACTN|nr:MFS transporter [Nocardioides albus]MBB3090069.1 putative MFS transporter [Nocardioides albus]GGU27474.1 MFS transporter [Nocardioides albus]
MTEPTTTPARSDGTELLTRLDRLKPGRPHRKLMFMGGLGYTFDSFDGALMGYALATLIVIWQIPAGTGGWLLSCIFIGYLVGALLSGILADRIGRKKLLVTALLIFCACSVMMGTAQTVTELFIWRTLAGIGIGAETTLIAPYISEFLPAKYRGRFVARTVGFLSFGYVLAGVVAPLLISPNPEAGWRIAAFICALPVLLLLWWRRSMPESPRFLLAKGRTAEAEAIVTEIERDSEIDPDASPATGTERAAGTPTTSVGVGAQLGALFAGPMLRTTLILWTLWFILTGVNYGFSAWMPALLVAAKGFTITKSLWFAAATAISQVPGYYIAAWLIDKMERKWLIAVYATGATCSALTVALTDSQVVLLVGVCFLAAFVNGSAAVYYTYTAELYPTAIRATGMGAASAIGRLGAISAPVAIGYLYEGLGFTNVLLILVACLACAVFIVVVFGEKTAGRVLQEDIKGRPLTH